MSTETRRARLAEGREDQHPAAAGRLACRPGPARAAAGRRSGHDLEIEGCPLVVRAVLNGKSIRRAVKDDRRAGGGHRTSCWAT